MAEVALEASGVVENWVGRMHRLDETRQRDVAELKLVELVETRVRKAGVFQEDSMLMKKKKKSMPRNRTDETAEEKESKQGRMTRQHRRRCLLVTGLAGLG